MKLSENQQLTGSNSAVAAAVGKDWIYQTINGGNS